MLSPALSRNYAPVTLSKSTEDRGAHNGVICAQLSAALRALELFIALNHRSAALGSS